MERPALSGTIRVRFFARYAELVGRAEAAVAVALPATVGDAVRRDRDRVLRLRGDGRGRAGSYRHGGRGALVGSPGRRAAPAGADPSVRGEHRDRRCGAAPGARVRGVSLRDRRGEAARARVEEGT